jgi:hypothetical protein
MKRIDIIKEMLEQFYCENEKSLIKISEPGFFYASNSNNFKIGPTSIFVASPKKNFFGSPKSSHTISFDHFITIKNKSEKVNIHNLEISEEVDLHLVDSLIQFLISLESIVEKKLSVYEQSRLQKENDERILREREEKLFDVQKIETISNFDSNGDGSIDLIDNEFDKLLIKNQKLVLEIDKNYVHQFVKISNYIKTKKRNLQTIFESIRDTSNPSVLEERISLLCNQKNAYEQLVFHSINMIGSLISEDLITFYEIYESFDKLGIYNSNWENEISSKLSNIGDKLDELMESIYDMEKNIVEELSHLTYVTQESFNELNTSVTKQLMEVESSLNFNNLLTGVQTYQLYKMNKNIKRIN